MVTITLTCTNNYCSSHGTQHTMETSRQAQP